MKRAKSIFLWCGELVEQWRGWLPYWGFCSKIVRTSIKKHRKILKFAFQKRVLKFYEVKKDSTCLPARQEFMPRSVA